MNTILDPESHYANPYTGTVFLGAYWESQLYNGYFPRNEEELKELIKVRDGEEKGWIQIWD